MPMSVCGVDVAVPPHAARVTKKTASAANRGAFGPIGIPPVLMKSYLNSLSVRRHLSSLSIAGPPQPALDNGVSPIDESDDPIGGEHHDQDQHSAIRDRGPGVLNSRRDLRGEPCLTGHPLIRLDRQEVGQ